MTLPTDVDLSSLTAAGQDLYEAEQDVLDAEEAFKRAKRARDYIATTTIPELMKEIGIEDLTMTGGRKVEVKEILSVTPKAANRPLVLAELEKQGAGALIKTTLSVPFGRDSQEEVKRINDILQREGLTVKVDTKVESSTLKKHVRTRLEDGLPVDTDLFGVREFRIAKFTEGAPKEAIFEGE